YLAQARPEQPVFISEIADQQSVPKKFLELILLDLKRHGLVHSYRGKKGGYALAKSPDKIFFGQVIRIIDGPLANSPAPAGPPTADVTIARTSRPAKFGRSCSKSVILQQESWMAPA